MADKPEDVLAAAGITSVADLRKIEAPILYASAAHLMRGGNDFTLLLQKPHPALLPTGAMAPIAVAEVVAIVNLSPGTLKDLYLLIGDHIHAFEESFGKVETDYTRRRDEEAKAKAEVQTH